MSGVVFGSGHNPIGDIVHALQSLFSRFASRTPVKIGTGGTGVEVKYNLKHRSAIRLHFFTPDDIKVDIDFDLNKLSKEYISGAVSDLVSMLEGERQRRQSTVLVDIRTPLSLAVADSAAKGAGVH